jgi:hypothetical protein
MAMFEAPIAQEAAHYSNPEISQYSNPYSTPEMEFEEESDRFLGNIISGSAGALGGGEGEVGHELEYELEDEASPYSHPYSTPEMEFEEESDRALGGLFGGGEVGHEFEYEDEATEEEFEGLLGNILGGGEVGHEFEDEYEADLFFKRIGRAIRKVGRVVAPIAKRLAPIATKALVGMIPGVGAIAAPIAGRLVGSLVSEAEMEVAEMENHFVNTFAETGEAEDPEVHEALLSELLAANAVGAQTEAEAEAEIGATIPLTIRVMRAGRSVLPVTPALVQANVRLVKTLRGQGQGGRELMRLLPTINRLAVAILNRAARLQRLTSPLAVRAMAVATNRVMSNPRKVRKAVERNMALRVRAQAARPRGRLPLRPSPRRRQVRV